MVEETLLLEMIIIQYTLAQKANEGVILIADCDRDSMYTFMAYATVVKTTFVDYATNKAISVQKS